MVAHTQSREIFGQTDEGQSVYRVRLTGGGLTADIMTWGAALQNLHLDGHDAPLVLGFPRFEDYPNHSPYFGATPGRYANRIAGASFKIDGKQYNTDPNFLNKHTLHGGAKGIGKRNWQIADLGTSHVDLVLQDPDGEMGFPGKCDITCSYVLKDDGVLHISYVTRTDATTVAGLAHHSYFNLDGSADTRDHILQIYAENYLPVDDELIPTGEIAPVSNTPFDFTAPRRIGDSIPAGGFFDHNFCLANGRRNMQEVARIYSPASNIAMAVSTTEPGLQFYGGHKVKTPVNGLSDEPYGAHAGFCLETQNWPDAPNRENFPNVILQPDDELRQVTEYKFSTI